MGKWTDKLYITHQEHSGIVGQHSATTGITGKRPKSDFKRLPFTHCALSLQPFENPVCTPSGNIFDLVNIIPFIKKFGTNPVTGEKLDAKSLIKLNFFRNSTGDYADPVTFRVFTDHTPIVAIATSGNVYDYDTVQKLNIKEKSWKDLLTDEEFTKKDIITLQDPHDVQNRNISSFEYLKKDLKVIDEEKERAKNDPLNKINLKTGMTGRVLAEVIKKSGSNPTPTSVGTLGVQTLDKASSQSSKMKQKQAYNAAHYSTGAAASAFTSTSLTPVIHNERALVDEDEFMYKQITKKGYARIITNFGNLNIELHCDRTPRTCHNFILLSKSGYYKNVTFHRSIKNFMIQGGDPTGTGTGGESFWKVSFPDEFNHFQSHKERGILSMANQGKNTNKSQFFITFRSCTHLDNKHTIFGKIVGGMDVLDKIEAVETDDSDRPTSEIKILDITVFVDPYDEYKQKLEKKLKREAGEDNEFIEKERKRKEDDSVNWAGVKIGNARRTAMTDSTATTVGKFINTTGKKRDLDNEVLEDDVRPTPKKIKGKLGFGNFDSW